ncbi:MAG: GTPase HflX [Rickettsiales bacterium]
MVKTNSNNEDSSGLDTSRCFVIHPNFKKKNLEDMRSVDACLEEAVGLAHAIDLKVVEAAVVGIATAKPATLFGSGKVEELAGYIKDSGAGLAIINTHVSPVQQRNLEKAWQVKVIDRTALILEIFGARARTHEGKLQVELAALNYQKSRLVRSWTHLERQRGGFGFLGGPGESQIEIDRRLIRDEIAKIKRQLEQVKRTRELHRKNRRSVPFPVVALVGYTNAGKSTLFNKLTGANVLSMDKLFATLDPTMRALKLPSGGKAIMSDTVGFVSDLPTELVAAFRATLEDVLEADILLHIRDISHLDSTAQKHDVEEVLKSLFRSEELPENLIEVCNKIDRLETPHSFVDDGSKLYISAVTGEGLDSLLARIEEEISKRFFKHITYNIRADDGKSLAWLHSHGKVIEQKLEDEMIVVNVQLSEENIRRFERVYAKN